MSEETFTNTWPKSTRLNQDNRKKFVDTVVADLMPDEAKPTDDSFSEKWADKVYDACYGPYLEIMQSLPKWMFLKADELNVNLFEHESQNDPIVKAHAGFFEFKLSAPRMMINEGSVYRWTSSSDAHVPHIPKDHAVIQAYKDHLQAEDDWDVRHRELRNTLTEVVDACNTSHQLFRAWPKAVKYAPDCFPYVEPAEAKRGGQTPISTEQLELTAKLAQTVVGVVEQN